jgi:hypothetical protein
VFSEARRLPDRNDVIVVARPALADGLRRA